MFLCVSPKISNCIEQKLMFSAIQHVVVVVFLVVFFIVIVFFLFILLPLLSVFDVRRNRPPCSSVVHFLLRQSIFFDFTAHSSQPSSLRPSLHPPPLHSHSHRPPSYAVLLSSPHIPIQLQPSFLNFLCHFSDCVVPIMLSLLICPHLALFSHCLSCQAL